MLLSSSISIIIVLHISGSKVCYGGLLLLFIFIFFVVEHFHELWKMTDTSERYALFVYILLTSKRPLDFFPSASWCFVTPVNTPLSFHQIHQCRQCLRYQ